MATSQQRIKNIRVSLETLQTKANNNELLEGEIYILTGASGANKIAKAISTNTFEIVGGSSGETVNYENLTANKTLTSNDATIQIYVINSNRTVYLPTAGISIGQKIEIWNNSGINQIYYLQVNQNANVLDKIYSQGRKIFRFDGANWFEDNYQNVNIGYSAIGYNYGTAVGNNANGYTNGTAVGNNANGYTNGTAVGNNANGYTNGTAVGYSAIGYNYGTAVGYYANTNDKQAGTIAIGSYSKNERKNELVSTASTTVTNKAQLTDQKYTESTFTNSTDTWREMFIDGSSARLVLLNNSIYNFDLQINCIRIATSSDPVGKGKAWQIKGAIARSSLDGTRFLGIPIKTLLGQDPDGDLDLIDVQVIADTTNNTLGIQIKTGLGTGNNTYRFSANIRATETRS